MGVLPSFGVLLGRLAERRALDVDALAEVAAVPKRELAAVLDGGTPSATLLRHLAPALRLHAADVFVIAGLPVPDDLAPLDIGTRWMIDRLVWSFAYIPAARQPLRELARSMPQEARPQSAVPPPEREHYPDGFGAVLLRLAHNRNLNWRSTVLALYLVAGYRPLSPATIGQVGHGRIEPTAEMVIGFATMLGIPAGDLADLGDVELPDDLPPVDPVAAGAAELIWEMRRLSLRQLKQLEDRAHVIRHETADQLPASFRCDCTEITAIG